MIESVTFERSAMPAARSLSVSAAMDCALATDDRSGGSVSGLAAARWGTAPAEPGLAAPLKSSG